MKPLPVVDAARALAVLMVLTGHFGIHSIGLPCASPLLQWAWYKGWVNGDYGVFLFFVISGFLITRLLASGPGGLFRPDFRDFYARRAGRILPLLALVCLFGLVFTRLAPRPPGPAGDFFGSPGDLAHPALWFSIGTFWFNWFRVFVHQDLGLHWRVLWSLSVEEQFYLFYPFILKTLGTPRRLVPFLLALVALGPLGQWAGYALGFSHWVIHLNSFNGFASIALGCLLELACERWKTRWEGRRLARGLLCGAGFLLVARIYLHRPYFADYWGNLLDDTGMGLGTALFLAGAVHSPFLNSIRWGPVGLIGKMSYGIYLFQATVFYLLYPWLVGLNEYAGWCLMVGAVLGLALLSHRCYERPMNDLLRRWITGRPVPPQAPVPS